MLNIQLAHGPKETKMDNPFQINYTDQFDSELVALAINGDRKALQTIINRHYVFVYNLALKMIKSHVDAEDLTQEVFIKVITSLSGFKGESQFRTWLYRITVNHFLNLRKRKTEEEIYDFEKYFNLIATVADQDLTDHEQVELMDSIEELRIRCTSGMLLCLKRTQRMAYILGDMFEMDHNLGAEIMGISKGNFRIKLMRARQDLSSWMNRRCSLINKANPCKCPKKTKGFIEAGFVDPDDLKFNTRYKNTIAQLSKKKATAIVHTVEDITREVFQSHPFQEPPEADAVVSKILSNDLIKKIINL